MPLKYIERTRSLMSNLNQIQEMTHRYWEEYSLDFTVCSQQHQQEEIDFLVQKFVDNGDQKHELFRILNKFQRKTSNPSPTPSENTDQTQIVVLPWVPGLSNNHHRVWMDDFKILGSGYNSNFKRKISEALFIKEKKPNLNVQKDAYPLKLYHWHHNISTFILYNGLRISVSSSWWCPTDLGRNIEFLRNK